MGKHLGRARWRGIAIGATIALLCLGVVGGPAAAGDESQASDVDRVAWAELFGVSEETAAQQMEARAAVDSTIASIHERPDTLAGEYFTHDGDAFTLHIVVKDGLSPELEVPELSALDVVWETAPRSATEIDAVEDGLNVHICIDDDCNY